MATNRSKTREQLLAEFDKIKQELAKTKKLEKVLIASNQQLEASEQQLNALNQQLAASNQQLTASDEKFRSVVEASPMGMHFYILKPEGKLVFSGANPAADVLLGIDNRQFIGKTIEEAFPPLSDTEIPQAYKDAAAHGKRWQTEQVIYDDGKISGAFEVYAFQTLPGKMVAVFLDITKQKQIEQKNEHFSRIFKDSLNEIYFFDADNLKFIEVNKAAQQNLGYTMEDMQEFTPVAIKPEFTKESFLKIVAPLLNGNKRKIVFETVHKRKDHSLYNVEVHLQLLHFDKEALFVAIILDITKRKRAEEKLKISHQQLFASEQQLRATNQQLEANEQQLKAANQQLEASNQQLRESEKTLKKEKEFSEKIIDTSSAVIIGLDKDRLIRIFNKGAERTTDYKKAEVIGKDWFELVLPVEDLEKMDKVWKNTWGASSYSFENVILTKEGEKRIISWQSAGLYKEEDSANHLLISIGEDITERKKALEEITNKEKQFRSVIESAGDAIFLADYETTQIILTNNRACRSLGYTHKELLSKKVSDLTNEVVPDEIWKRRWSNMPMDKAVTIELEHRRKDGSIFPAEVRMSVLIYNGKKTILGFARDISERKKFLQDLIDAKRETEISERKFRELFEKSGDSILILENRKFVDCNSATIKLLDYSNKEEFLNTHPSKISPLYQPDGRLSYEKAEEMMDTAIEKRTHRFEWDHLKSNGEIVPVEVLLTSISNEKGKEIIHTVWRDITERRMAQKRITDALEKATESDRLKSAFLANMSHEIRTPMNGIIGFTNLLNDPDLNSTERRKYTAIINRSSERLLNTINDLIDISKIESGQMKVTFIEISINKLLDELYGFFKPEVTLKGLSLISLPTFDDMEDIVLTDDAKLHGILTNLIKNAIKFTEKGSITFGYYLKDDFIEFFVKDTGIGIPENRQQAVFSRFVQADIEDTRAIEGSGLGLTISKAYVEMLGGKMWLLSEEGKGSSFRFTIPYTPTTDRKSAPKATGKTLKEPVSGNLELLIVEDEETSSYFLEIILKNRFREIIFAKTGKEAIEICRNNPEIDIVLMDIKMPEMNGYEATREIRKFNKEVVIIAQTAFALAGDKEKAIEAGCDDYIPKPIDKELLLEMINHHVKKKKGI